MINQAYGKEAMIKQLVPFWQHKTADSEYQQKREKNNVNRKYEEHLQDPGNKKPL